MTFCNTAHFETGRFETGRFETVRFETLRLVGVPANLLLVL
jgi:hypothetical protein